MWQCLLILVHLHHHLLHLAQQLTGAEAEQDVLNLRHRLWLLVLHPEDGWYLHHRYSFYWNCSTERGKVKFFFRFLLFSSFFCCARKMPTSMYMCMLQFPSKWWWYLSAKLSKRKLIPKKKKSIDIPALITPFGLCQLLLLHLGCASSTTKNGPWITLLSMAHHNKAWGAKPDHKISLKKKKT